jgi:hypothetical protein
MPPPSHPHLVACACEKREKIPACEPACRPGIWGERIKYHLHARRMRTGGPSSLPMGWVLIGTAG